MQFARNSYNSFEFWNTIIMSVPTTIHRRVRYNQRPRGYVKRPAQRSEVREARLQLITRRSMVSAPKGYRIHSPLLPETRVRKTLVFCLTRRTAVEITPDYDGVSFFVRYANLSRDDQPYTRSSRLRWMKPPGVRCNRPPATPSSRPGAGRSR